MIEPSDFLITGGGRLDPSWYYPHDLDALLIEWLGKAESDSASDALITARVYRMAFTTAADILMSEPANQRDRDKSSAFLANQLDYWLAQARAYKKEEDLIEGRTLGPVLTDWNGERP